MFNILLVKILDIVLEVYVIVNFFFKENKYCLCCKINLLNIIVLIYVCVIQILSILFLRIIYGIEGEVDIGKEECIVREVSDLFEDCFVFFELINIGLNII